MVSSVLLDPIQHFPRPRRPSKDNPYASLTQGTAAAENLVKQRRPLCISTTRNCRRQPPRQPKMTLIFTRNKGDPPLLLPPGKGSLLASFLRRRDLYWKAGSTNFPTFIRYNFLRTLSRDFLLRGYTPQPIYNALTHRNLTSSA